MRIFFISVVIVLFVVPYSFAVNPSDSHSVEASNSSIAMKQKQIKHQEELAKAKQKAEKDRKERQSRIEKFQREENQEKADPVYQEALDLFRTGRFEEAKKKFQEVQGILSGYKLTAKYIVKTDAAILDNQIHLEEKKQEEKLKKQQEFEQQYRQEKFNRQMLENRLQWQDKLEELDRIRRLNEQADEIYAEAEDFYRIKDFAHAREKFLQVQNLIANYKSTKSYLTRIDDEEHQESLRRAQEKLEAQNFESSLSDPLTSKHPSDIKNKVQKNHP